MLKYFGDFRWWERPNCLSSPRCTELVPDVPLAVAQLRDLFDDHACKKIVEEGRAGLVFPLFLETGFVRDVDDLLQLGRDLAEFPGWRARPKLIGELLSAQGWEGARLEVGVQAGLRRMGLAPSIEPAAAKDEIRPDFVVDLAGVSVGLELKSLADPNETRNRRALCDALVYRLYPALGREWRGDVTLELSESVQESLARPHETFKTTFLPQVERELATIAGARLNSRVALPSIGSLILAYPRWNAPASFAGSYDVWPNELDCHHLLQRALRRARDAARQLGAVDVKLRVAVIWGSRSLLPAEGAARAAHEEIVDEYNDRWDSVPLDWIVFFNAHTHSPKGWTIDLGLCRLPHARGDIPQAILDGLTSWGHWRR